MTAVRSARGRAHGRRRFIAARRGQLLGQELHSGRLATAAAEAVDVDQQQPVAFGACEVTGLCVLRVSADILDAPHIVPVQHAVHQPLPAHDSAAERSEHVPDAPCGWELTG